MPDPATSTPPLYFKQLELGPLQNFVYLVGDPQTRQAAIIDPGWEVPTILRTLQEDGYQPAKVFVTHTHFDHVQGLEELLRTHDVPVHVHGAEAAQLPVEDGTLRPISGGETVSVGRVPLALIHTPGHTPGSTCLLVHGRLLSGDTLFIRGCGRCDLPGGDPSALYHSLSQTLHRLEDDTVLCPGHNYAPWPTMQLGEEKQHNPFLASSSLEGFLRMTGFA